MKTDEVGPLVSSQWWSQGPLWKPFWEYVSSAKRSLYILYAMIPFLGIRL